METEPRLKVFHPIDWTHRVSNLRQGKLFIHYTTASPFHWFRQNRWTKRVKTPILKTSPLIKGNILSRQRNTSLTDIFSTRIHARERTHVHTYNNVFHIIDVLMIRCSHSRRSLRCSHADLRGGFIHDLSPTASCTRVLSRQGIRPLLLWMRMLIYTVRKETDHAAYS